jgi:diaminopimelate epimerase
MIIPFNIYQETAKNFIITDNCTGVFIPVNSDQMKKLSNRRFEIVADGFILLSCSSLRDFKMKFFSTEGFDGTMCGNRLEEDIIACGT